MLVGFPLQVTVFVTSSVSVPDGSGLLCSVWMVFSLYPYAQQKVWLFPPVQSKNSSLYWPVTAVRIVLREENYLEVAAQFVC